MFKRRALAFGMLLLWGYVISLNIVFRHAHRLPDGRVISHVHPYKAKADKGPFSSNPHSKSELAWLDTVSNTPFLADFTPVFELQPAIVYEEPAAYFYNCSFHSEYLDNIPSRGPPSFSV